MTSVGSIAQEAGLAGALGRSVHRPGVLASWRIRFSDEGQAVDRPADGRPGAASPSATRPGLARRSPDPGR